MESLERVKRGRWHYVVCDCVGCGKPGEVRMDRWRQLKEQWRCGKCAAIINHQQNPGIKEAASLKVKKHGESINKTNKGHWLYRRWSRMKYRCKAYPTYLKKGVRVCEEWNNSYTAFRDWSFSNGASPELELDRTDTVSYTHLTLPTKA